MADSGQSFIKRNRAPRVHISYADPYDADVKIELPFVMGVLSDLSGNAPGVEKPDIGDRDFVEFDMDNFDKRLSAIEPGVTMRVKNRLNPESKEAMSISLRFKKMEDFSPAAIAREVPALAKLLEARENLANLKSYMDGKAAATDQLKALLSDPELMRALHDRAAHAKTPDEGSAE